MKKVYLMVLGVAVAGASFAQRTSETYDFGMQKLGNELHKMTPNRTLPTVSADDRALNILWTEDFSGGTGLTTGNGTWVTEGAEAGYWTIGTDPHPLSGFGWAHALDAEHMTWDSYNPNSAEAQFATTIVNGAIYSPQMDLSSATNGVVLEFDLETMYCCNYQEFPWYIYVSTDDGATWSAGIPLDFGVDRNVATEDIAHPMTYSVDISSYLDPTPANNNDCRIKFSWEATNADGNGQINTHYFWLIDDILIYEVPANEIQHQRLWLADIFNGWEYGDIPTSQAGTLTCQSKVKSIGSNDPTNLGMEITVFDGSMTAVYGPTVGGTLNNPPLSLGETDTITFDTGFDLSTLAVGTYMVRGVVSYDETDEVPGNDTIWRTFNITENNLSHIDYDQPVGRNYGDNVESTESGAFFPIYANTTLHGVDFYLRNGTMTTPSSTDIEVEFYVYQDNGASIDYLYGPYTFDITSGMLDQWNTFNFHMAKYETYSNIDLAAGSNYVVVLKHFAGEVVWYQENPIDEDASGIFYHGGDQTWYLTGGEPWISLNFDESLTVEGPETSNFAVGQNRPNPFNNNSVIQYTLNSASDVTITFTDVTGKVVKTINQGTQAAGTYTVELDGSEFAEGTYFYTFTVGNEVITKSMVVTK